MTGADAAPGAGPIRVVVADDHPLYRDGLVGLIGTVADMEVVGQATTGHEALDLVAAAEPDLLVLDLEMPGMDGYTVLRHLAQQGTGVAVLVVTMHGGDDAVFEAMKSGARGYLVKSADPDTVLSAIRTVGRGGAVFSAALGERLSDWFTTLQRRHGPLSHLTPREREVLGLMVRGRDTGAIAALLEVSPKTVRNVVSSIYAKLQVADRSAAVAKARAAGLD